MTNYLIKLVNCKPINQRKIIPMEAVELVFKTLQTSDEPLSAGAIAAASKLDRKDVDKAMKALKAEGRIVSPKRCFWTSV